MRKVAIALLGLALITSVFFVNCQGMKGKTLGQKTNSSSHNIAFSSVAMNPGPSCDPGICRCALALNNIIDDKSYSLSDLMASAGGSPEGIFFSGSENIPLVCHVGIYLDDNRPEWLESYFTVQKRSDIGLGGKELFSAAYFQMTVGAVLAAHNHAIEKNHTNLEALSSEWLRAYWAHLALAATEGQASKYYHTLHTGLAESVDREGSYGLAVVGTRNYSSQLRALGQQRILLSIALDHSIRDYPRSINDDPGMNGGFRAFLRKVGYNLGSDGKVNLRDKSLTPRQVGLTDSERQTLRTFIQSNGNQGLNSVLDMMRPFPIKCQRTYLRTTEGVISWFGTSTQDGNECTVLKGGSYSAVSMSPSLASGKILVRVKIDNNPVATRTWREGSVICSSSDLPRECISIPGGQKIYEIAAGPSGIQTVGSSPPSATPPNPPPSSTPTPSQPPSTPSNSPPPGGGPPPPTEASNCATNTLCLLNGRFKVMASYHNQFSGQSGTARIINNSTSSGFFHFGDSSNIELIVKVLDFGSSIKVFYGQLTNLRFTLQVKDTLTGRTKLYTNTAGDCGGLDNDFMASNMVSKDTKYARIKIEKNKATRGLASGGTCVPNQNTLCLLNNRIKITSNWRNQYNNQTGSSKVSKLSEMTGGLYFSDNTSLEALVKAVDFGTHILIAWGTLSNFEYQIHVTDTSNGRTHTYTNPASNYCGGLDSNTF